MTVRYDLDGPVAVITIDRPAVRNAVDGPTAAELNDAFDRVEADDAVAAAVLTGAEGTFCAGADLKAVAESRGNVVTELTAAEIVDSLGPMGPTRRVLSKPVIAAVEGHAVAGGLELALWCDMRVAASDAVFGVYCRRWGVPLIDGGTVRLPRLIGHSHAMDMILTGRPVSGDEALRMGLANRLCEPGAAIATAVTLGGELAMFPQRCLRSDRRSTIEQWGDDLGGALANEVVRGMETIRSGETRDGAARFAAGAGRGGSFDEFRT
ncbi:MAG: crotonase/enoyl-CoA hydratase family protein [Actinomycetota bacterium]